jgi:predicted metal-binding membrane protein
MDRSPPVALLILRQRVLLLGGLLAVTATSWAYLYRMEQEMGPECHVVGPSMAGASMGATWILTMWVVMMVAMMVPTTAHTTLFYARFLRGRDAAASLAPPVALFLLGYLAAWTAFSAFATALQLGLERAAFMSPMAMKVESPIAAGVALVVAGAFQWSPWKYSCLRSCRSPLGFFMTGWRDGRWGAFRMGLHHGLYCLGCCWALMLLLFVLGTMNMLWIAALTAIVLLEKIAPRGDLIARATGVAFVAAGVWMLLA